MWTLIQDTDNLRKEKDKPEFRPAWATLSDNARWWQKNFSDTPERLSGWGHDYICSKCTALLTFDREEPQYHVCTVCGLVADNTAKICAAWVYLYRHQLSMGLMDAAVVSNVLHDDELKQFVLDTVMWYAEHYVLFREDTVHGRSITRGKVMFQSLDEAVWGHNLLRALSIIGVDSTSDTAGRLYHLLFLPMARMFISQADKINNIPLWRVSYAACAALFFCDESLYAQAMTMEYGVNAQTAQGFTEDGLWFENSATYHYYALEAATHMCVMIKEAGREAEETKLMECVRRGYAAYLDIIFSNGQLPCTNDGWKYNSIAEIGNRYLIACRLFPELGSHSAMTALFRDISPVAPRNMWEGDLLKGAWLYGVPDCVHTNNPLSSTHMQSNCVAILRTPKIEVFTKYGNLSRSHAHPDALQICIAPFALDTGTPGYSSALYHDWFCQTVSHCTFAVDGQSQSNVAKGSAIYKPDEITMTVGDAYEGVTAVRHLYVNNAVLADTMTFTCDRRRQTDWFFHGAGDFKAIGEQWLSEISEKENGYQFFSNIYRFTGDTCHWTSDNLRLTLRMVSLPKNAQIFLMTSPDNPGIHQRHTVMIRTIAEQDNEISIKVIFTIGGQSRD